SAPPTNLPFTYNCGMVGQLEYSLIPWRTSWSLSTSTVATFSTPHASRICTAAALKPHIGASGVPFMYSTTGLPVTCCLIFSCASIGDTPRELKGVPVRILHGGGTPVYGNDVNE